MGIDPKTPDLEKLLAMAGKKVGTDPAVLKQQLNSGRYDTIFEKLSPEDAGRMQQFVKNPQLAQQLLKSPEAQQLIQKLTGKQNTEN